MLLVLEEATALLRKYKIPASHSTIRNNPDV